MTKHDYQVALRHMDVLWEIIAKDIPKLIMKLKKLSVD